MTNPEELRRKFDGQPKRHWWVAVIVAGVLVAIGLPLARPAWRALKAWRASQFLQEAEELLAQQQISLAFERGRSALQLEPSRADVLRLNARLLAKIGSELSLTLWQRLLDSGQASADDRVAYIETALALERADAVSQVVTQIMSNAPAAERDCRMLALYDLQNQQSISALGHARDAHRLSPWNPTNVLLLASLLESQVGSSSQDEARQLLWTVARTNGPLRLEALRLLANRRDAMTQDRERIRDLLQGASQRNASETVLLAEVQMQLDPAQSATLASNLVAQLPRDDLERLTLVVETLLRRGRYEEVLVLTTAGRSLVNRALFLGRYEALSALGKKDEAYRHLLEPEPPLAPFDLALVRALAAQNISDIARRDAHLRDLLNAAGENPLRLRRTAQLAEAGNTQEALAVAMDAWKRLSARTGEAPNALRHLQRLADRQGDTWTARDFARRARRINANDDALRLDIAYYDLLLGDDLDRALTEAERQLASRTNDIFVRAVAALGHLRLGSPARARAVFDRVVIGDLSAHRDALPALVATYGANGLDARARELAAKLPITQLRPEERELIRQWLVEPPLGF